MKKQILVMALIAFMSLSFNTLMAQGRGQRPEQESVDTLTVDQTQKLNNILEDYDSEAITEEDAKSIMKKIKDEKIPGGKGIEKAMTAAGFDFKEIRELAPPPEKRKRGSRN